MRGVTTGRLPVRWLTLYARSRQVPASLTAVLISAVSVWALAGDGGEGPGDPRPVVLVLATGAMAASIGLGGQDLALDRTAAIRWAPRRAAHVLLAGAVVAATLLAVQGMGGGETATTAFVVRDSAGLMGLAALGTALAGAQYAWTLPFAWLSLAFVAPPRRARRHRWRPGCCCPPARRRPPGRPWPSRSRARRPTRSRAQDADRTGPPNRRRQAGAGPPLDDSAPHGRRHHGLRGRGPKTITGRRHRPHDRRNPARRSPTGAGKRAPVIHPRTSPEPQPPRGIRSPEPHAPPEAHTSPQPHARQLP